MLVMLQLLVHFIFKLQMSTCTPVVILAAFSVLFLQAGDLLCPWEGRARVQLQPVLQWISQLHLFKGRAVRVQQLLFAVRWSRCSASTCTAPSTLKSLPLSLLHKVSAVIFFFITSVWAIWSCSVGSLISHRLKSFLILGAAWGWLVCWRVYLCAYDYRKKLHCAFVLVMNGKIELFCWIMSPLSPSSQEDVDTEQKLKWQVKHFHWEFTSDWLKPAE